MRQRGLADAGHVLDQQMAAGEQAGEGQVDLRALAEHDLIHLFDGRAQRDLRGIMAFDA
jgi:hypothetical protein